MLWDYQCRNPKCGKKSEHWDDENPMECPFCHGQSLERMFSRLNISRGSKSQTMRVEGSVGVLYRVGEEGITGAIGVEVGQVIKVNKGDNSILALGK